MAQAYTRNPVCPKCKGRSGIPLSIDDWTARIAEFEYLLGDYTNQHYNLKWKCKSGHEFVTSCKALYNYPTCPLCGDSDGVKWRASIAAEGYETIDVIPDKVFYDGYKYPKARYNLKCPKAHSFVTDYRQWIEIKQRCSTCVQDFHRIWDAGKVRWVLR